MKRIAQIAILVAAFAAGYSCGVGDAAEHYNLKLAEGVEPVRIATIEEREPLCTTDTDCYQKFGEDR